LSVELREKRIFRAADRLERLTGLQSSTT